MHLKGHPLMFVVLVVALFAASCSDKEIKRVNEQCSGNDDCADDICHRGLCASSNPADDGQPCSGAGNCKSFSCVNDVCQPGTQPLKAACRYGQECASKNCKSGTCHAATPVPDGGVDLGPDGPVPDGPVPDAPLPDLAADLKKDAPIPDAPIPDSPIPDMPIPDLPVPDLMPPDLPSPDGNCSTCYSTWSLLPTINAKWKNWSIAAQGDVVLVGGQLSGTMAGEIHRSEKGKSFTKVASAGRHVTGIAMDGQNAVAIAADGWIHHSSDGGKNWSTYLQRCWTLAAIGAIDFMGPFIVTASKGLICWSSDGGKKWSTKTVKYSTNGKVNMKSVSIATVGGKVTALVVGDYKDTGYKYHHYIFRSTDLGKTWDDLSTKLSATTGFSIDDAYLHPDGKVFMVGASGFVHLSADSGNTWSNKAVPKYPFKTIVFDPGANTVLISGYQGANSYTYLSKTGGQQFSKLTGTNLSGPLNAAAYNGAGVIYLVDYFLLPGRVLKSSR